MDGIIEKGSACRPTVDYVKHKIKPKPSSIMCIQMIKGPTCMPNLLVGPILCMIIPKKIILFFPHYTDSERFDMYMTPFCSRILHNVFLLYSYAIV